MARKRLHPWLVRQFVHLISLCIYFQSWICARQDVPSTENAGVQHQNNISSGMYLNVSRDVTIRVGEQLRLNCTIVGAGNSSNVQLSWYYGTQSLHDLTRKLSNETVQLVIDHVSWINSGTYNCRENNSNRVQPESVMVRVGDIPGPPQDVWVNNVDFRTYIHWTAPLHLGGLHINYAIQGQCKNASTRLEECEKDSFTLCEAEAILPEHGSKSDQFTCRVSAILHLFALHVTYAPVTYIAFVEASNVLGSRKSNPVEFTINHFDALLTTPQPAVFLAAREVAPPGTVKLTWRDAREHRPMEVEYTILYHKDGDSQNKSVTVKAPKTNVLISDLVGFSCYHFYLLVRYARHNTTTYSIYSEAVQRTVRTNISAPRDPPVVTNCSHWRNHSSHAGLMVTWTIPLAEYFNGPMKSVIIFYRCQREKQNIEGNLTLSNATAAHSALITAVEPSDTCHVWMKMCNKPGLCSSISNMCLASGSSKDDSLPGLRNSKSIKGTVLISLAGAAGGVVLVIIIVMCYRLRRRRNGKAPRPLRNVLVMPPVIHGYDEIEEPLVNNNFYEVINV